MLMKNEFDKMKNNNEKITMLTAYDYPSAKMAEKADVDMILVGDSLGMVVLGYSSTVQVTLDDMIHHAKAARRGAPDTFLVVDMPFMSYHISLADAMKNAMKLFQETNAQALKIEGASPEVLNLTRRLTDAGIPVIIHLGLTPQSVNVFGGFKVQGREEAAAEKMLKDAIEAQKSGAIGLVLECIPHQLAAKITSKVDIPVIGIGSGPECDGQVLVYHDVLNYGVERLPKFAKSYADFDSLGTDAVAQYIREVKSARFPDEKHSFS